MESMELSGEIMTLLALVAVACPFVLNLEHTFRLQRPSGVASLHWRMWTWCFFLQSIYFNFHPRASHAHGHHLVTDVVKFPTVLCYGLPALTFLVFACRIHDLNLTTMPRGATFKVKALTLLRWSIFPAMVGIFLVLCAYLLLGSNFRRSLILYFLGSLGCIGALLFAASSLFLSHRSEKDVAGASIVLNHLPVLVQMLGFLTLCLIMVLNFVNVDWLGVLQFGIMFLGDLGFVISRYFAKRRGYSAMSATEVADAAEEFEV